MKKKFKLKMQKTFNVFKFRMKFKTLYFVKIKTKTSN